MVIAVVSGKWETDTLVCAAPAGETTVAVNLALSLAFEQGDSSLTTYSPRLLDCVVEEPNAALFLDPSIWKEREAGQMVSEGALRRVLAPVAERRFVTAAVVAR